VLPLHVQLLWPDKESSFPIATGIEARLIEAEAQLVANDVTGWLATHNALRATVPGLGALTDPGTQAAREDLHFRERAFWLFSTGHRLGDLRRMVREFNRTPESVFPTGAWIKGGTYGPDVNFPVTQAEENNPNFQACTDRNA
jgi:starch-binding outer membrane protein, SusD/RagB family